MKKNLPVPAAAEACETVVCKLITPLLRLVIMVDDFVAEIVVAAAHERQWL